MHAPAASLQTLRRTVPPCACAADPALVAVLLCIYTDLVEFNCESAVGRCLCTLLLLGRPA